MNSACDASVASGPKLNESQVRHVLSNFEHADKLLSEIEGILTAAASKTAFPKFVSDITPAQTRMVEAYVARLRTQMLRVLDSIGGQPGRPNIGALRAIRVHLTFVRIAIEECTPNHLQGYGTVPDELVPELEGLSVELEGIVSALESALSDRTSGANLQQKLARLPEGSVDAATLLRMQEITTRRGLVEFRPAIIEIVDRLASPRFEIAVFGPVSCGKSSMLNQIVRQELLPVGVNPVTSVPTRIVYAASPELTVSFADRQVKRFAIQELREFVTEDRNPGNTKAVARIVAGVASDGLRDGIVLVDTPGLGSLATAGASETKAYLPHCDLGVLLVNSSATLSPEDIATMQALLDAGVQPAVVMSKADLLSPEERAAAIAYIEGKIEQQLGARLRVFPVSIVIGSRDLLERWFEEQILPLYGQHRTLAVDSIRRKVAILRESIARALEAKLRPGAAVPSDRLEDLRLADQKLRSASGAIARVEKNAISAAETVAQLAPTALALAARRLLDQRRNGNDFAPTIIVRQTIAETCRDVAREIVAQVEQLAGDLRAAIAQTAASAGIGGPALDGEFRAIVRDVPQIDLTLVHFDTPRRFAVNRQLKSEIGVPVSAALVSYSKILQTWTKTTIGQIKNNFEAHADVLRGQLARLLSGVREPAADLAGIESEVQWLRGD